MFVSRTNSEKARRVAQENADYFGVPYAYGTDTSGNWHAERASTAPQDWARVFPGGLETRGGYGSRYRHNHYGDLLKGNPRRRFASLQEKIEAGYSPWVPSPVAIASTHDGSEYMVIAVHSDIGWDFPTLRHMFPASFKLDRVRTFSNEQARVKYTEAGGPQRFKLRVDTPSRWTEPLPLNTPISYQEFDRAAGFNITGGIHGRSRL